MKTFEKMGIMLLAALPLLFLVSCNDDDDDNGNNKNDSDAPQISEMYDKAGDVMVYQYDKKKRISTVNLFDDGNYNCIDVGYNPLKLEGYDIFESSLGEDIDRESLYDHGELGRFSDIKTNKKGNVTSCTITKSYGVAKAKITYDSEDHPIKIVHEFSFNTGEGYTDIAELTWENGNLTHYTVTDDDGMYLESFLEYYDNVNLTGQATYGLALAYWNEVEYFSGVLGKLSEDLPKKLTLNYYFIDNDTSKTVVETDVLNISYSHNDDDSVVEEYLESEGADFWVRHLGKRVHRYEVYYGYTK